MKRFAVMAFLIAIQFFAGSVLAVDKLQADLIPQALRARSQASIPVEVRFRWNGTRILEGHLELELRDRSEVLERYRSGDMALTTGEQTFRILLPPPVAQFWNAQVEAHMKFVTAHEVFDLDYSILTMPTYGERSLAVGWCNAHNGADAQASGLEQSLQFERFAPPTDEAAKKLLITTMVRLTPEELPLQPLDYTAFDVLVLATDGFAEAREGQLHAVARWVKGGGSVCVFVGGGLQPHHLSFLNELAESSHEDPAFLADSAGNLLPGHEKMAYLHSGMGRSVIVTANRTAGVAPDPSAWRQAAVFLWKFRAHQAQAIADTGHWEETAIAQDENGAPPPFRQNYNYTNRRQRGPNYGEAPSYAVQQTSFGGELMSQLMPRTVRLIPFNALAMMLGLFLLMIGPVDYFVLGWLRRRRFTWALFPATSVAFMLATVAMANYFLGRHDQRRSLVMVDVGADGSTLRWNRYELVFAARDKQAVTELNDALWTPLNPGQAGWTSYNPANGDDEMDAPREIEPPWYEGAVPAHFRTSESIRQWRPVMDRVFSFGAPPVPSLSDWPAVEQAWPNLSDIRAKLSVHKPFRGDVCAVSGTNSVTLDAQSNGILSRSILDQLCRADSSGLFALVSQISPTGGGNYEDAQALDTRDSDSVLAIVTQTGDDIIVYRRFFHGN